MGKEFLQVVTNTTPKGVMFHCIRGHDSTLPGKLYDAMWTDRYGNVNSCLVSCPELMLTSFDTETKLIPTIKQDRLK
eukprot:12170738-Ditylum_brightwellii.AAC.1